MVRAWYPIPKCLSACDPRGPCVLLVRDMRGEAFTIGSPVGGFASCQASDSFCALLARPRVMQVMVDPVVCEDGHSYERGALEAWFAEHDTSPLSNVHLPSKTVLPNINLRSSIDIWRRASGY